MLQWTQGDLQHVACDPLRRLGRREVVQSTVALLYPRQESEINVLPYLLESLRQRRLRSRGKLMPDSQEFSPAMCKGKPVMVPRFG